MTTFAVEDDRVTALDDDRRMNFDRRLSALETNYTIIFTRLDGLDAIRNQITGMVVLVKFIGWGGIIGAGMVVLNYLRVTR